MRCSRRLAMATWLGAGGFVLACGDSSAPVVPKTLAVAAGDGQSAPTGATLPVPLSVLVTGSDGRPFPGATVTWTVTIGPASLGATSSATDAQGSAATTLTLGAKIGTVVVQASVEGVTPITFTATALDPCQYVAAYTLGATVTGTLATTDCSLGGFYTDFYALEIAGGQHGVTLSMTATASTPFDTWLELYRRTGEFVALNDDIDPGVNQNSRIEAIVVPGSYVLGPSSYDPAITGPYSLSAVTRSQTLVGCELVWVTRGVTITDAITASDCRDSTNTHFEDITAIFAEAGTVLRIAEHSAAFNARLTLVRFDAQGNPVVVASNDDSATTTTDAFLDFTAPQASVYLLVIGTSGADETGAYTLDIAASSTLNQGVAVAAPIRSWPGPFRGPRRTLAPPRLHGGRR